MNNYEKRMNREIQSIIGLHEYEEVHIEEYPLAVSRQILKIYLEWACQPQNIAAIELGRNKIRKISSIWLNKHFLEIAQEAIDFLDEWEFRRLIELVIDVVPNLKKDIFKLVAHADNMEIIEVIEDFQ
ncbi:MAG: hypothetical protein J6D02_04885 [Lachnospira sp.]|nr:hypothetical protein [Lachnospira sp.]